MKELIFIATRRYTISKWRFVIEIESNMFAARNSSPVHGFNTEEIAAYQVGDMLIDVEITGKTLIAYCGGVYE